MYEKSDLKQFKRLGIKPEQVNEQLEHFKNGFDFITLQDAATPGNGIRQLSGQEEAAYTALYQEKKTTL